jgi:hypothetical protein
MNEFKRLRKGKEIPPFYMTLVYAGLGEKDEAFTWLEKAYKEHSWELILLKVHPGFDPLRSDPRFQELVRQVGLPQ